MIDIGKLSWYSMESAPKTGQTIVLLQSNYTPLLAYWCRFSDMEGWISKPDGRRIQDLLGWYPKPRPDAAVIDAPVEVPLVTMNTVLQVAGAQNPEPANNAFAALVTIDKILSEISDPWVRGWIAQYVSKAYGDMPVSPLPQGPVEWHPGFPGHQENGNVMVGKESENAERSPCVDADCRNSADMPCHSGIGLYPVRRR